MLAFSAVYAVVSYFFGYYGEMIIYLAMQIPVCTTSLISWLKNPAKEGSAETKTGKLTPKYTVIMLISTAAVTTAFYFILRELKTENLIFSTISVATSFSALFLMVLRVPAYAAVFMLNDAVLIVLWSLACTQSLNYVPMVVCFFRKKTAPALIKAGAVFYFKIYRKLKFQSKSLFLSASFLCRPKPPRSPRL